MLCAWGAGGPCHPSCFPHSDNTRGCRSSGAWAWGMCCRACLPTLNGWHHAHVPQLVTGPLLTCVEQRCVQRLMQPLQASCCKEPSCGSELGFGFCQIFKFAQHSTGCMVVRYMLPHRCKHVQLLGSADCSHAAMSSTRCWQASAGLRSIKLADWHGVCAVSSVQVGFQDGAQPGVHTCCVLQVSVGSLRLCK